MILRYLRGPITSLTGYVLRQSALSVVDASPVPLEQVPSEQRVEIINDSFLRQLRSNRTDKEALHLVFAYSAEEEPSAEQAMDVIDATMNWLKMPNFRYPRLVATHYNTAIYHQHLLCPAYDLKEKAAPALLQLSPQKIKELKYYLAEQFPWIHNLKKDPISQMLPKRYLEAYRITASKHPDRKLTQPIILQFFNGIVKAGLEQPSMPLYRTLKQTLSDFSLQVIRAKQSEISFTPKSITFLADKSISSIAHQKVRIRLSIDVMSRMLWRSFPKETPRIDRDTFWIQNSASAARQITPIVERLQQALEKREQTVSSVDWKPLSIELKKLKTINDKTRKPQSGTKQDPLGYSTFPVLRSEAPDFYVLSRELLKLASLLGIPPSSLLGINIGQLLQLLSTNIHQLKFLPPGGTFSKDTFIPQNLRECQWPNRTAEEWQELQDICYWVDAMMAGDEYSNEKYLNGFTSEIE